MSNFIDLTFNTKDITNIILMHTYFLDHPHSEGNSAITTDADAGLFEHRLVQCFPTSLTGSNPTNGSILLKWRLVDKLWKSHVDTFLKEMWKELSNHAPDGFAIPLVMSKIQKNEQSITLCFGKLARHFKEARAVIPHNPMPIRVGEYRMLQAKIEDAALQKIWNKQLIEILIVSDIAALPPTRASAAAIRTFLNDPANSVELSHITMLSLDGMDLRVVPPELNQLSGLQKLSLGSNELKEVPNFNLPNLRSLSLEKNKLKKVPTLNLPNLRVLYLGSNQLKEVPNFSYLPNLQRLYLYGNQLKEVPNFNLLNLQVLSLNVNKLKEVPNFNLLNLQVLSLDVNKLKEVPNFSHLPNLQELYLKGNPLIFIPDQILKRFPTCNK